MKRIFLTVCLVYWFSFVYAINVDSLKTALESFPDTTQIKILKKKSQGLLDSKPEEAKEIANFMLDISQQSKDNFEISESLILIAYCDKNLGNFQKSINSLKKALKICEELKIIIRQGYINNLIGVNFASNDQIDSALFYYLESEKILENLIVNDSESKKLKMLKSILYTNLGVFYYFKISDLKNSKRYFNEVLQLATEIRDSVRINAALSNLGMVYRAEGDNKKALIHYEKAFIMAFEIGNLMYAANASINIAGVYKSQRNFSKNIEYLNEAVSIFKSINAKFNVGNTYWILGEAYFSYKYYEETIKCLMKALSYKEFSDNLKKKQKVYLKMSDAYEKTGNVDTAFIYFKKQSEIEKQIEQQINTENFNKLLVSYETEKKEKENLRLTTENKINKLSLSRKNTIIYSLVFGSSIGLLLVSLLLVQYRKRYHAYKALVKQNIKLAKQELKEKETSNNIENTSENLSENFDSSQLLINKLKQYFEDEKPYLRAKLKLDDLSIALNTNRSYLSKAINDKLNMNFYELLNEFRIKESRHLLMDKKYDNISIEGIGQMVGFASRSSFYNYFNKTFGITPLFFRKSLKDKN
ncbi:MAG: tetratricopeptide repeat protein [Bacteroidetes bacterium]|jgi:tetratricopeptide (TPR) repeat protein|nr:tetratricopeptide repeat protein [Bacteroidota bacterium]MBT7142622.1 tetratricopeptide repeat protein [Bacteroidota bacterium]MBT7490565.1 tetratricopeptide repeat protein [Bacteroidota bacterium]